MKYNHDYFYYRSIYNTIYSFRIIIIIFEKVFKIKAFIYNTLNQNITFIYNY